MNFTDKYLYKSTKEVGGLDDDLLQFCKDLATFAKLHKMLLVTANQVGREERLFVLDDGGLFNGYGAYINLVITPKLESIEYEESIPFGFIKPRSKLLVRYYNSITINVLDVCENNPLIMELSGDDAKPWQVANYILNGIDRDAIVPCDYLTIRKENKIRPNARCPVCGRKMKLHTSPCK